MYEARFVWNITKLVAGFDPMTSSHAPPEQAGALAA